jgi:hypothetical protein
VLLVSFMPGLPAMLSQIIKPATEVEIEEPEKRVASAGNVLPDRTWEGEILPDITKNKWKLGKLLGAGSFGEVLLASSNSYEPVD